MTTTDTRVPSPAAFPATPEPGVVGAICRLAPFVGTKAQAKLLWKVTRVLGDVYFIQPVTGGRTLRVFGANIVAASPAEAAAAARVGVAPDLTLGTVVTLDGKAGFFVVINLTTAGKVTIAPLNGGTGGYRGVTPTMLTVVTATVV